MNRIILAGGSGFLGRILSRHFQRLEWETVILTRSPRRALPCPARLVGWDGVSPGAWVLELEGARAVINLAGRSVNCRYNAHNRRAILDSRVTPTRILGEAIGRCQNPPQVWLNASTATIYKHTFGAAWDESGQLGGTAEAEDRFSVEVATAWERAFHEATTSRTRKVALRSAMVLANEANSVLPMMRWLVRCGLGGSMAGGGQYVSWLHAVDFCRAVEWLIEHEEISGVMNLAAPHPVTNAEFMRTLRHVSAMPFGLPATRWMLELGAIFLRTETELVIKSRRVVPGRLLTAGFHFDFPRLTDALRELSGRRIPADADRNTVETPEFISTR